MITQEVDGPVGAELSAAISVAMEALRAAISAMKESPMCAEHMEWVLVLTSHERIMIDYRVMGATEQAGAVRTLLASAEATRILMQRNGIPTPEVQVGPVH